jgi:hypothetical protein
MYRDYSSLTREPSSVQLAETEIVARDFYAYILVTGERNHIMYVDKFKDYARLLGDFILTSAHYFLYTNQVPHRSPPASIPL